jgi:hypothetical protein
MVHQSLELQRRGVYLMVSLVSVFQAVEAPRYFGAVLNLVQKTSNNSQRLVVDLDEVQKVISYSQPFAKFSLN